MLAKLRTIYYREMPAAGVCRTAPAVDAMRAVHAAAAFPEGGRQQTNDRRL